VICRGDGGFSLGEMSAGTSEVAALIFGAPTPSRAGLGLGLGLGEVDGKNARFVSS
jgi:hypothetical protein